LKNGAVVVSPDSYTPQKGDVAVFAGSDAHPHGHITIFDGKQWVSDFKQKNMSPYRTAAPPVTIYRFPDNYSSRMLKKESSHAERSEASAVSP
jgi:type VI secretion system secreted protein VgrG